MYMDPYDAARLALLTNETNKSIDSNRYPKED